MEFKKDDRKLTWAEIEEDVASRAYCKDSSFKLSGNWKKFIREQNGYKVYQVDSNWIRNNLSIIFGHGGHGFVHEFIPMDEIWVTTSHFHGCGHDEEIQEITQEYFDSCVIHEITECEQMKKGKIFWIAHQIANEKERELGLISDKEIYG